MELKKFDIVYGPFPGTSSNHVHSGNHYGIIMQNNIGNRYSPTLIVLGLTSKLKKLNQPTHMLIYPDDDNGLTKTSMLVAEQITTISKEDFRKVGRISNRKVQRQIYECMLNAFNYGENKE